MKTLKRLSVSFCVCIGTLLDGTGSSAMEDRSIEKRVRTQTERARDFNRLMAEREAEERRRQVGADKVRRLRRERAVSEEKVRQRYLRTRKVYDSQEAERIDRLLEREAEARAKDRDLRRRVYVKSRRQLLRALRTVQKIDEFKEFGL